MKLSHAFIIAVMLLSGLIVGGCNMSPTSPLGAGVGGAEDIGYARTIIESGGVPSARYIVPEGLYSEHDIPTPVGDCTGDLCLALGYGYAPAVDSNREALFVHLGMTSTIKREEYKRPKLQLALVVDRSGSMEGGNMSIVKMALHELLQNLNPDDEVSFISFNSNAAMILPTTPVGDKQALSRAMGTLTADGGTDIEEGLEKGYAELARQPVRQGTLKRLMLFTDALPNSGDTDPGSFRELTKRYADQNIGLSAFGVGLNFGQDLIYHISQLRGGNFFYLQDTKRAESVFKTELDYLVSPLVNDLRVQIKPQPGMKLVAVYGLPTWQPGNDLELNIPTVFLSSNRGAIILRYERVDGDHATFNSGDRLVDGSLSFVGKSGTPYSETRQLLHTGSAMLQSGARYYSHQGTRLGVALTNIYLGMRLGCELHAKGEKAAALEIIERARAEASIDNATLNDAGLAKEIALLEKLAVNVGK